MSVCEVFCYIKCELKYFAELGGDVLQVAGLIAFVIKPICILINNKFVKLNFSMVELSDSNRIVVHLQNWGNEHICFKKIDWTQLYFCDTDINWPLKNNKIRLIDNTFLGAGKDFYCPLIKWYKDKQGDFCNFRIKIKVKYKIGFITMQKTLKTGSLYSVPSLKQEEITNGIFKLLDFDGKNPNKDKIEIKGQKNKIKESKITKKIKKELYYFGKYLVKKYSPYIK